MPGFLRDQVISSNGIGILDVKRALVFSDEGFQLPAPS